MAASVEWVKCLPGAQVAPGAGALVSKREFMADEDLDKKLDEGLALLRVLRPPVRRVAVVLDGGGVELLRPADIVYFTTSDEKDRRLYVYTADGKQHFNFR